METVQGTKGMDARMTLAVLAAVALFAFVWLSLFPRWEYLSLKLYPERDAERVDKGAFAYATIRMESDELAKMGNQGWELVSSSLELETAYPNFGRSEYVTGLQPNIRPQSLVLIFKRQKPPWR